MGCAILIESVLVTLTFQSLTALSSCSVSGVHFNSLNRQPEGCEASHKD